MKFLFTSLVFLIALTAQSQKTMNDSLPFAAIPEAPQKYTAGSVVSRMVDGLGFRYYWATEQLTDNELDYSPGNEARTIRQNLEHVYMLSKIISNSAKKQATDRTVKAPEFKFDELRKATLENFKIASDLFMQTEDLNELSVVFKRANGVSEFPFWNTINGPIEDAVWHAGQIVILRRLAGKPINPKVNVFTGKLNE